ncbi:MAG: hypothetical protein KAT58_02400 [candidate division Zixibacteria bacterium]|nr:hypothetical protein [candidate division Zixibacteria bacterium]
MENEIKEKLSDLVKDPLLEELELRLKSKTGISIIHCFVGIKYLCCVIHCRVNAAGFPVGPTRCMVWLVSYSAERRYPKAG